MSASWSLWIALLLPFAGALANLVFGRRLGRTAVAAIASGAVGLAFLAVAWALFALPHGGKLELPLLRTELPGGLLFSFGLLGDPLSLWFMAVITGVGFLIHVYSAGYMADEPAFGRYFIKLNYFIFAMSLLVLADNFMGLVMGWANVGLASYLLIGFYRERPEASAAATKAFIVNLAGEVGMVAGTAFIFATFKSLGYAEVFSQSREVPVATVTLICMLLLVGAVAKSAQLPLHIWLPDAMQGPTPVSALIHAATMVTAGVYLVARCFPLFAVSPPAMNTVAAIGAISALFGAVVALAQVDIKRVLAFSTMSQVGYMFLGAGVGALPAALFHFLTHAFFKALLFLAAGVVIHAFEGEQDIRKMGGLGKGMPFAYWVFVIGGLSLAGLPPFSGFFSKDEILGAALATGHVWEWAVGVAAAGLTAFYTLRLLALVFAGTPASPTGRDGSAHAAAAGHSHDTPSTMAVPVAVLAVLSIAGGWIGIPGLTHLPAGFLGSMFGEAAAVHAVSIPALAAVLGLALVGGFAGARLYGPGGAWRARAQDLGRPEAGLVFEGIYLDVAYETLVVAPARAGSDWVGRVADPRLIDGAVDGLGRLALLIGGFVRGLQAGYLRRYSLGLFAAALLIAYYFMFLLPA